MATYFSSSMRIEPTRVYVILDEGSTIIYADIDSHNDVLCRLDPSRCPFHADDLGIVRYYVPARLTRFADRFIEDFARQKIPLDNLENRLLFLQRQIQPIGPDTSTVN